MNGGRNFLSQKSHVKKIKYATKAEKGQPYLRLTFFDGTTSVICGKLCDLPDMIRVNRGVVVAFDAPHKLIDKVMKIKGGPVFRFSRRMWMKYRPNM
jgi:hypothetical protein